MSEALLLKEGDARHAKMRELKDEPLSLLYLLFRLVGDISSMDISLVLRGDGLLNDDVLP